MKGKNIVNRPLYSPRRFLLPNAAYDSLEGVLIPNTELQGKIKEMSMRIAQDYKGKDFYALPVLNGAIPFFSDLLFTSNMLLPFSYGCCKISSYDGTESCTLRLENFDNEQVRGKDVLVIEDIIDTGRTLTFLIEHLGSFPRSVRIAVLLDKPSRRVIDVPVHYTGFQIPNHFVVGYGLDYNNKFRYLNLIGVLKKEVYESH